MKPASAKPVPGHHRCFHHSGGWHTLSPERGCRTLCGFSKGAFFAPEFALRDLHFFHLSVPEIRTHAQQSKDKV